MLTNSNKYIHKFYEKNTLLKPCMFKFIQLLKTHNTKEIQLLASFIKRIFIVHKQSLFD